MFTIQIRYWSFKHIFYLFYKWCSEVYSMFIMNIIYPSVSCNMILYRASIMFYYVFILFYHILRFIPYFVYAAPKFIVPYKPFIHNKYKNDNFQGSNRIKLLRQFPHILLHATPYNLIGHWNKKNPLKILPHNIFAPSHSLTMINSFVNGFHTCT